MNRSINRTGLLLVFIGLIINLFFGLGSVLALIGLFMSAGGSDNLRRSRNYFIGTMCVSVAVFIVMVIGSPVIMGDLIIGGFAFAGSAIAIIIIGVILCILAIFFNYRSFKHLLFGCMETVPSDSEEYYSMEKCFEHYKRALIIQYALAIATCVLMAVPVLNIILVIATICAAIYMFICNIWIIISVFRAYKALDDKFVV